MHSITSALINKVEIQSLLLLPILLLHDQLQACLHQLEAAFEELSEILYLEVEHLFTIQIVIWLEVHP